MINPYNILQQNDRTHFDAFSQNLDFSRSVLMGEKGHFCNLTHQFNILTFIFNFSVPSTPQRAEIRIDQIVGKQYINCHQREPIQNHSVSSTDKGVCTGCDSQPVN